MSIFVILTLYTRTDLTWKVELEKLGGHDVHYWEPSEFLCFFLISPSSIFSTSFLERTIDQNQRTL